MGTFRVTRVDAQAVVFVHLPETHDSQVVEIRNPKAPGVGLPVFTVGDFAYISLSAGKTTAPTAPVVEPLPNTVQHEAHLAAAAVAASEPISEVTEDTEEPVIAEDGHEAASTDETSTETTETA